MMDRTTRTLARSASREPPRLWSPRGPVDTPLTVHLRLSRESASSNGAESPPKGRSQRRRRREKSSDDDDDEEETAHTREDGATSDSNSSVVNSRGATRREKKPRKPTYVVQKEEKEALMRELRQLEVRAEALRAEAGMPSLKAHRTTKQRQHENRVMESARRAQLLSLCGVQSLFAAHVRATFAEPLKVPVYLGRDIAQRRATLMNLRREKLELASRFIEARLEGVDEGLPFDDSMNWTSPEGDVCFCRTDVSHFEGVHSVKQVFDALHYFIATMEITISEVLGQLTLREDIDCVDTRATNQRLVTSTDHGIVMEANSIMFTEYYKSFPGRGGEEFAVITMDTVDEDELYPYCPQERVRRNVTAVISLSVVRKPRTENVRSERGSETAGGDIVVAMFRSSYLMLKKPLFPISAAAAEDLKDTVSEWGRVMSKTVRDHVYTQMNASPWAATGVRDL